MHAPGVACRLWALDVPCDQPLIHRTQAMLHCLRALLLLGVPMPWDAAYRRKRRWWHFTFDACFVAGMCCCSRGMQDIEVSPLGAEGAVSANRRVGEQEMGEWARPARAAWHAPQCCAHMDQYTALLMYYALVGD